MFFIKINRLIFKHNRQIFKFKKAFLTSAVNDFNTSIPVTMAVNIIG